jgi:hypothetical protein
MHATCRLLVIAALLPLAAATSATSVQRLPDGRFVEFGSKEGVPYLAQWTEGAWVPIPVAAELVPAKGEYESVGADAQGNLYVSYDDETNPKKKTGGLLARVGGGWARLGTFQKGWSGSSRIAAHSATDVFLDVWLTEERRRTLLHWDGTTYTAVSLPEGTEEMNGLLVHDGKLVLLAYGRGPSGTYRDASGAFRRTGDSWERMGAPAGGTTGMLITAADGTVWRLGRVAERWNGTQWEEGFPFANSSFDGYRITDACPGANGLLYLVLQDEDSKAHLACWPGSGGMLWLKGTPGSSKFDYGVYDLFVDEEAVLHANGKERYPFVDFDYATDGYPTRDDQARQVFDLFNAQIAAHGPISDRFLSANAAFNTSRTEADFQALTKATNDAMAWFSAAIEEAQNTGVGEKRNRLYDAHVAAITAGKDQTHYMFKMSEAIHNGTDFLAYSKDLTDANGRQVRAIEAMDLAAKSYVTRNGLN